MKNLVKYTLGLSLLCASVSSTPVLANTFNSCTRNLIATGLTPEAASMGCAEALVPGDLAQCVQKINKVAGLPPEEILQACFQVRRPRDLAICFNQINHSASGDSTKVLDNCRKSLLPRRYAQCVVGVNSAVDPNQALDDCLAAEAQPKVIFPSVEN